MSSSTSSCGEAVEDFLVGIKQELDGHPDLNLFEGAADLCTKPKCKNALNEMARLPGKMTAFTYMNSHFMKQRQFDRKLTPLCL